MGLFLNPDNSGFQAALNAKIYVDKTGLLNYTNSVLESTDAFICNSRPRRFGKSVTADMLTAYYSKGCNSETMFSDYEIAGSKDFKKYLNHYDVIQIDIQWCIEPAGGPEKVLSFITKGVIDELRVQYPNTISESITSLPEALSLINIEHNQKFVVIIDEWDVLIRDESENKQIQEDYISFLRGMFKGNVSARYIALAYLTGILPIKKIKTQSALNNFDEYTMVSSSQLAPYIGFTEEEVRELCKKYQKNFEEVKRWYDGYFLEEYYIYNPRAVVCLMTKGKYQSYWSKTGTYNAIVPLINMDFDGLKTDMIAMLSGASVEVDVSCYQNDMVHFTNKDDVLTCLIHLGYLGYDQNKKAAFIPNEEIRQELNAAVRQKKWNEMISFQRESDELLEATLDMDADTVASGIEKIHMEYASAIAYNDENSLSSVLTIAYLSSMKYYFKPIWELPMGRGFADYVYIPKPEYAQYYPALLIELKWNKKVSSAIDQIKEKKYPDSLVSYTGDILLIGISYDKKSKEHHCIIEKFIS